MMGEANRRSEAEQRRKEADRLALFAHIVIAAGGTVTIERSQFEKCRYPKIMRVDDPVTGAVHFQAVLEGAYDDLF